MSVTTEHPTEENFSSLLGGIVDDLQTLVRQELKLVRNEVRDDLTRSSDAAKLWAVGAGLAFLSLVTFTLTLVHLLNHTTGLTLWVCFGIVTVVIGAASALLIMGGRKEVAKIDPMHSPPAQALTEAPHVG